MFEAVRQNSAYRSVRYSTIRKDTHTADAPHRLSQIRVKRKPIEESTFYNTRTIELKPRTAAEISFENPERNSYMQTFHSLFQSQKRVKDKEDDTFNACELKLKFANFNNSFLKDDGTEFTLLDPFNRPYTYLNNEIEKQEKQLRSQRDEIRLIRAQMNTMKRNITASLKNSEQEGRKGIDRLRHMIKKNEVESQETRMRVRREITYLFEKHDENVKIGEDVHGRARMMQRDIFSCEPFELEAKE